MMPTVGAHTTVPHALISLVKQEQETSTAMRQYAAPITPGPTTGSDAAREPSLRGWRLILARAVAFSVINATIGLGIVALVNWRRLAIPCEAALNACLMAPEQVAPLARLGLTPTDVALGVVVLSCAAIALTNGVAALLLWRRSDDAMALLVAVTLVLLPAFFTPMYQSLTGGWRVAGGVINSLGGIAILLLVGLFPSGRFVPRWLWLVMLVVLTLVFMFGSIIPSAFTLLLVLTLFVSLIASQVYRFRRVSTPEQRQQTKWAVTGIILAIVVNQLFWQPVGWIPALQRKDSLYSLLLYPDFVLLISILAVCFGVAIVRYRLYDIDLIIRRTLIYGLLTAILAGIYAAVVFVAQVVSVRLTAAQTTPPSWLIVITTLLIAALFNPLRQHIQVLIDRRFYRSRYDAAQTLTALSMKLREETDLEDLRNDVIEVVQHTMQPAHVTLWLRTPNRQRAELSGGESNRLA
jgi:hypothetical protein